MSSWGLELNDATVATKGRIFNPEDILFNNEKIEKGSFAADWSRASTNNPVLSAVSTI